VTQLDLTKLWTIVPARGLTAGKSRLAPVLNAAVREALNRELLERTLAVVSEWCGAPQRCFVVSPCSRALALARDAGATAVREGARAVGLNRAVRLGVARAAAQGATHVLILPADLPHVTADALSALANPAGRLKHVVLAPDKTGSGTNALLIGVGTGFKYAFGPASFAAHRAAAKRAGLTTSIVRRAELEYDLDTPDDLAACTDKASIAIRTPGEVG
jgi:2-phospho-L-lactate guanylyltransferase